MRSFVHSLTSSSCVFMYIIFTCIAFATAIQQGGNDGIRTERATILINDSTDIIIDIDTSNSNLSYVNISPSMTIRSAYAITSSATTVFFFWSRRGRFWDLSFRDFASISFTSDDPFVPNEMIPPQGFFHDARRLYYYDGAEDIADGNIFTLFIENRAGRKELLRSRIREDRGYIEIPLSLLDPGLCVGTRLALVGWPILNDAYYDFHGVEVNHPVCYLLSKEDKPPLEWAMLPSAQIEIPQTYPRSERVERIVCFRELFDNRAKREFEYLYQRY